jgi:cytochrome P450
MKGPARDSDWIDTLSPAEIGPPNFDDSLRAWVLSRYSDVLAAFHCPSLLPSGLNSKPLSEVLSQDALQKMRRETCDVLSPAQLRIWGKRLSEAARSLAKKMPEKEPADLVGSYSRPLCLTLAAMVTGIEARQAQRLCAVAEPISASAAEPYDPALKSDSRAANAKLRGLFGAGPEPLRDSGFVALAHTLPCLLANAWYALLESPSEWRALHNEPELAKQAVEELLRCSALPRILFRRAVEDVEFNGVRIRKGERIVLRVLAANRDPEHFAHPNRLDVKRLRIRHLALGAGPHSCVGAGLIRMAAVSIMRPLLERFPAAELVETVSWKGGSGFRFPAALWVRFGDES